MYKTILSLKHFKKVGRVWESEVSAKQIDNILSINITSSMDARKSNLFKISLKAEYSDVDTVKNLERFSVDDRLEIRIKLLDHNDNLLDELHSFFIIRKIEFKSEQSKFTVDIQAVDQTEMLLKMKIASGYKHDSTYNTAPLIIKNILERVNNFQPENKILWKDDNPMVKKDGSPFPTIIWSSNYGNVFDQIQKLSSSTYTEDGNYVFYLRTENDKTYFYWRPISLTYDGTIKERSDFSIYDSTTGSYKYSIYPDKFSLVKGLFDIKNFLIINAGEDPDGNGITTFVVNPVSVARYGMKSDFQPLDIATSLYTDERKNKPSYWTEDSRYPTTFPYTTYWTSTDTDSTSPACTKGEPVVINSKSEFLSAFRREAKWRAQQIGMSIINSIFKDSYELKIDWNIGTSIFSAGDVYNVQSQSYNFDSIEKGYVFRISEVEHAISKTGWKTSLKLKSEEYKAGGNE